MARRYDVIEGGKPSEEPDGPDDFTGDDRPEILVHNGQLAEAINEAEDALLASKANLYQSNGMIVRPTYRVVKITKGKKTKVLRCVPVSQAHILERMTSAAIFKTYDVRSKQWIVKDCPKKISEAYFAREGLWRLPHLIGIITVPTLRDDGSILERPGYDAQTGILFDPQGKTFAPIPEAPTQEEAFECLGEIKALLSTFPFVKKEHRSVALSGILTALIRRSLDTAPMHCFSAPTAGSGKSMLVDIAAVISTGKRCPVISQSPKEEENEKRLGAEFMAGSGIVSIDNCDAPIAGDLLCQLLTQQMVKIRVLGLSKMVDVMPNATMFGTGNNLRIGGDVTRRSLMGCLDHGVERPELIEFDTDALEVAEKAYERYAIAGLTILRAFHCAGYTKQSTPFGSFNTWSRRVRDALIWLGEADPVSTVESVRATDPKLEQLAAVLTQWSSAIGDRRVTCKEVIDIATAKSTYYDTGNSVEGFTNPSFREALLQVAGERGNINSIRLGRWLGSIKERVFEGHRMIPGGLLQGMATWLLEAVKAPGN